MEHDRNLQNYAREKLCAAVYVLATHAEEVRVRLRFACEHLVLVPASALPHKFRTRFEAIMGDLTRFKPKPEYAWTPDNPFGITELSETLHRIRKETGAAIAVRLVQLTSEFEYLLEHTNEGI